MNTSAQNILNTFTAKNARGHSATAALCRIAGEANLQDLSAMFEPTWWATVQWLADGAVDCANIGCFPIDMAIDGARSDLANLANVFSSVTTGLTGGHLRADDAVIKEIINITRDIIAVVDELQISRG